MKLIICADDVAFATMSAASNANIEWIRVSDPANFAAEPTADAYFNFLPDAANFNYNGLQQPVFINSVANTHLSADNIIRFNGWNGFIEKDIWEMAGIINDTAASVLKQLDKTAIVTQNIPGFISARTIAMIVNEAFFVWGDDISSKAAIDIAMKLGTNYPLGPFEWAEKIGHNQLYDLLKTLAISDPRYECAPALK
ncbi:MAG: 3-hydroxyacyl-CoA dehydrogenase family protein, partial [Ferruginibacter sp.]